MRVEFGRKLIEYLQTIEKEQQTKVYNFAKHVKSSGLNGLEGRNKSSAMVPTSDPEYINKVKRATEKKFWHYHVGIEFYENGSFGDRTSMWVLHYANHEPHYLRLGMLDFHPPFRLPHDRFFKLR